MSNLVDDVRRAPTPESLESRRPLVSLVKEAQTTLFRAAIEKRRGGNAEDLATDLRRYAIWLDQALLADNYVDGAMLELAASLYEFAADLSDFPPSTIYRPPLNDLLRSALLASLTPFQGRASIVAGRVADLLGGIEADTALDRCHVQCSQAIASLLARRFHDSVVKSVRLTDANRSAVEELERRDASEEEYVALDLAVRLARAASQAASGMLTGIFAGLHNAIRDLEDVRTDADRSNDSNRYWLSERMSRVVSRMHESSMHRLLGQQMSPVPVRYRNTLAREGFLELWGPQLEALRKGILKTNSDQSFVMSIPTGSGKSLLAELAILASLHNRDGWALYIAPSRSLVNQASHDLRRRLQPCGIDVTTILAGAEQSILLGEEVDLFRAKKAVVVTTPEKMDIYLRNAQEIFQNCQAIVIDEVHKLGEARRGSLLESVITQFLVLQPEARLLLMSGVMSNAEELATWLDTRRSQTVIARRRATRQIFAVAVRQDSPIEVREPTKRKIKKSIASKEVRRVDFQGGLILVHEDEDLSGDLRIQLPNVFQGHFWQRRINTRWIEDRQESGSSINDHAVAIAQSLATAPGTVLVFVNNTVWAESCARKFILDNKDYSLERDALGQFISLELGEDHELADLCRRGVAFHHARLPGSVQRAVEFGLEQGWLKAVFATASLREGINTPATAVVIAGLTVWESDGFVSISVSDFANMAGRAGRPRSDTEGRVVLIPNSLSEARAIEAGREYVLSGEAALRVKSQLGYLRASLQEAKGEFLKLPVAQQRFLLGLKATGLDNRDGLETFFYRTLWSYQEPDEQALPQALELANEAIAAAENEFGERFGLAARVGFSLSSSESLRDAVLADQSVFELMDLDAADRKNEQLVILLTSSLRLEEVRGELAGAERGVDAYLAPLQCWISGANYGSVLAAGRASGMFRNSSKIGAAVKFCSDASNLLSWAFGAAWSIVETELENPDPYVGVLPLLVRYGVPSASAAYVSLLGVADRNAAQVLGTAYDATGQDPSLQAISSWMDSIELEEHFPSERHSLRAELLRRQAFRGGRSQVPYNVASFRSGRTIPYGTELRLVLKGSQILLEDQGIIVGEVLPEDAVSFRSVIGESSKTPLVVVVQEQAPGELGAIVAIRE